MTEIGTTERVLRLLALLQQRPVWTGPELAERLGVTTRSIRRDVERLRALGYPVNATQGAGGGYQLGAGKALPPLLLDDDEAIATAVSLRLAAGGTVAGASEAAVRTLAKLDQVLPARLRGEVRALHEAIATLDGARIEVDADALLALAKASRDRVRVEFGYEARDGARTQRRLEPYQLVATGRRWYLMAFDLEREDWRTFRLDRLHDLRVTTWRFRPREHPDPVAYVQRAISQGGYPLQAVVVLHEDAATIRERIPPTTGVVEPLGPGRCRLTLGADDPYWLAMRLAHSGCEFEVLEPPELVAEVAALGQLLSRAAGRSNGHGPKTN
ncbi:helix-turn-helix transcriptional regulator [Nocardioides insulae]|uniref:helix-turn-helix transcriptional regulator n=1 Tax=Nocardioides insulae TaxID=394734 RepID=UPI00049044D9|nr:YafY family protein [Nocardioides insulae]